jgi:hypothetical protein
MRNVTGIVLFAALCPAGCSARPATAPTGADFGGWSWYSLNAANAGADDVDVSAYWGSWNKKLVYVVLADAAVTATTRVHTSDGQTEYRVALTLPNAQKAELRVETADGRTGRADFAGQSYDLARGTVFVLLSRGEKLELSQLPRDVSDVTDSLPAVHKLIRDDPELVRPFAKAK